MISKLNLKAKDLKDTLMLFLMKRLMDESIKEIITSIYANNNPNDPAFYFKALGDKKLSVVFKDQFGIIVNHKKIYRMRKELGFVRPYKDHFKHSKKRPTNHEMNFPNSFWEFVKNEISLFILQYQEVSVPSFFCLAEI